MRPRLHRAACLLALLAAAACAKTRIVDHQPADHERLPRPATIFVYDFAATPEDVAPSSALAQAGSSASAPLSAQQVELGRALGREIASALVDEIRAMGLHAEHATRESAPRVGDLVIRGSLLRIDEGSATERVAVGLGMGEAELKTAVEGYHMTESGLVKLGGGTLDTNAGKTPGAALPLAVAVATKNPLGLIVSTGVKVHGEMSGSSTIHGKARDTAKAIADVIRPRFQEQGWI